MSLRGITVAITSSRRATELATLVEKFGGVPYIAPTIGLNGKFPLSLECKKIIDTIASEKFHYFVFMTGVGVFNLFHNLQKYKQFDNIIERFREIIVIARSNKPALELRKFGITTRYVPKMNTIEGIIDLMTQLDVKNKNVGILWHGDRFHLFRTKLESLGSKVFEFSSYSYSINPEKEKVYILKEMGYDFVSPTNEKIRKLIEDILAFNIDSITFTSPPAVKEFFEFARKCNMVEVLVYRLNHNVLVVSIGPSTSKVLEKFQIKVDIMPLTYRIGSMIYEMAKYISSFDRSN